MRISELIGKRVVDDRGRDVGQVHDVRLRSPHRGPGGRFEVSGLMVGPSGPLSSAAHAWGYAEGRAQGPAPLTMLTRGAIRDSRLVPSDRVLDWQAPELSLDCPFERLQPLAARTNDE